MIKGFSSHFLERQPLPGPTVGHLTESAIVAFRIFPLIVPEGLFI